MTISASDYRHPGNFLKRTTALLCVGTALTALAFNASAACTYTIDSEWSTGFTANITLKNDTGAAINNWNVNWQYSSNRMTSGWNANFSGTNPYNATNMSWNGSIAPGQSISFGLQGEKNGSTAERPTVTGAACNSATTSSVASSSSTPTTSSSSASSVASALLLQEAQAGFCRVDGTIDNNHTGFTGSGFANTNNAQGAAVVWAIDATSSGRRTLTIRYANGGTANRNGSLVINGGSNGNYTVSLPTTGAWTTWQTATIDVDLVQGNNIVQLSATTAEGLPNIDSLSVVGGTVRAGNCGSVSSSSSVQSSSSSSSSSAASAKKFIGNITTSGAVRSDFTRYWNQITPENESKWGSVEGTRNVYNWAPLDRIYAYARQNNIPVKAHTFVWGAQSPSWLNNLSGPEVAVEIEQWIRDYCARYPDTAMIDVVNEAVPGHQPAGYAQRAFGNNWIQRVFQLARQYCPNSILILNDYNNIRWQHNEFIALAKAQGNYIDAVGLQAHELKGMTAAQVKTAIDNIWNQVGKPIYISEYDIGDTNDQVQLQNFQAHFPVFYNHPHVHGITSGICGGQDLDRRLRFDPGQWHTAPGNDVVD
nr:endo-1,4-beta-xylanase (EC 3.2.1.8) B - Pseudomonas fluorescens subsp. cellulosa [Cellvibrio japonicus]CAA38389.1 Xylanase B [Cellvibrio japonicus]